MTDGICPFAEQQLVPNGTYAQGSTDRVGFGDHTAGGFYGTLRSRNFWITTGYCTHFGISRKGEIVQLVNILDRAWGQGTDANGNSVSHSSPGVTWIPFPQMNYRNPNEYLISTEHEDAIGHDAQGNAVFAPNGVWTPEMYNADLRLKRWCVEEIRRVKGQDLLRFGVDSLAGHYMFDPVNRAGCPGNSWKSIYRQQLYNDLSGTDDVRVEHQVAASFLTNNSFANGADFSGVQYVNAQIDFNLPSEAKYVEVEFLARNGYAVIKSGSGIECGRVGWKTELSPGREVCTIGLKDTGPNNEVGKWFSFEGAGVYIEQAMSISYIK